MARLKPGDRPEAAAQALQRFHPQIREETLPQGWRPADLARYVSDPFSFSSAATGRSSLRSRFQQPLTIVLGVVGIVLLVACANLANLMIARATARRQELSLRLALGASRLRLIRQLLLESLLLAGAGATLGLAVAHWGSQLLVAQLAPAGNSVFLDLQLDWRVLAFTAGAALVTALLFGLAPSLGVLRVSPNEALADHGRRVAGDRRLGLRNALVVAQVALSLVLLVAAVLFGRTLTSLMTRPLGFDPSQVLVANVSAQRSAAPADQRHALFERLVAAAAAVPGVSIAAASPITPLAGNSWNGEIEIPSGPELPRTDRLPMMNAVTPGWFGAYGMPIRAGRDFTSADRTGAPDVAVVNDAFARRFFPGRSPLRARVKVLRGPQPPVEVEIVGLVDDAVYGSLRTEAPPTLYFPFAQQAPWTSVAISVRSAGLSPDALTRPLADALMRVDQDLSLTLRPMAIQLGRSLTQERLVAMLAGFFGALALVLSALGLYGVTAFAVNRRRSEIGIRLALGAHPATVVRMVLGRVAWMIGIGAVIGTGVSLWAAKFVETLVYGLDARDPATLAVSGAVLACVGLAAAWRPARRASRIDPALTLRLE
jgi:predicted permease